MLSFLNNIIKLIKERLSLLRYCILFFVAATVIKLDWFI